MSNSDNAVSRLADVLGAQLDLVNDTTEQASTNLVDKTSELHATLTSLLTELTKPEEYAPILNMVIDIQMMLQFQDIVRQQIDTVRAGLDCLGEAGVPSGQDPQDWFQAQIARLEGAYVMQGQWDIHNSHLGIEPAAAANGDDLTLF